MKSGGPINLGSPFLVLALALAFNREVRKADAKDTKKFNFQTVCFEDTKVFSLRLNVYDGYVEESKVFNI
jgi:hypothetical protein